MSDDIRTTCYTHLLKRISDALGMDPKDTTSADNILREVIRRLEADNK